MNQQTITEAHGACRTMYTALSELLELTTDLSEAIQRQDQVSVQLFLSMRQEPLERLRICDAHLRRLCSSLPQAESAQLRQVLNGQSGGTATTQGLERTVRQNRQLLEQITRMDERINRRMGGKKSFYEQKAAQ
ncbi:hypothetical protein ACTQ33_06435 [Candidatus Avoscillospira sp. LCP25S3_F1]|uniref:hypothetical protein n=1 Tax=Candidatus Avoscillospira sp. LCP25S3_F1 TaxID=3438825 RepID=UPI003F92F9C8